MDAEPAAQVDVVDAPLLAEGHAHGRVRLLSRRQDSTQVRSNVTRGIQSLSRGSRVMLTFASLSSLARIVASIVILSLTAGEECDAPLQLFNIVYIVHVALAMPLYIIQRMDNADTAQDETREEQSATGRCVDRLKALVDFFATVWFLFGNYWLFASTTCVNTSPMLFYTTLAWIILGYVALAVPLLLCAAMICCLPCVLLTMRAFQQAENRSAAESVIKSIPKTTFHVGDMDEEDAMCVICLSSYTDNEYIKKLPCKHHFHDHCIDEWLVINRTCPLCMRKLDVNGEQTDAADAV